MKKAIITHNSQLIILTAALLLLASCQRQTLEEPSFFTANIPITIDWSESSVKVDDINNVSASFYPKGETDPIIEISGEPHLLTAKLQEGVYDIIIHNEMIGNTKGIDAIDDKVFGDYRMMIQSDDADQYNMFYTPAAGARMIKESEAIGAWSYRDFEVTKEMIEYTRTRSFEDLLSEMRSRSKTKVTKSDSRSIAAYITKGYVDALNGLPHATRSTTKSLADLSNIKPQPRTVSYALSIEVENMNNIQIGNFLGFEGVIDGFIDGARVFDGEKIAAANPTYTIIPNKTNNITPTYKSGSTTDGFITYDFTNSGHLQYVQGARYTLTLKIILHNGEGRDFVIDITDQIQNYTIGSTINIHIGDSYNNGTETIVLPESTDGGFGVGDWDDAVDVPL